jgi:hypothetical protein
MLYRKCYWHFIIRKANRKKGINLVPFSNVKKTNDRVDGDQDESVQRTTSMSEIARKEHEFKQRTLNIELEWAELQKQTAVSELNASEIKRQLIENQAVEYYS